MKKNNDNPWSPRKVAEAHGYFSNLDEASSHHEPFASFIEDKEDARIVDIGCGNGRVLNNLNTYFFRVVANNKGIIIKKVIGID